MSYREYKLSDLFGFDKQDITMHMMYEMHLGEKLKDSFNYIMKKLPVQKLKALEKTKWQKGKNYDWAIIRHDGVVFIIRKFHSHFTIFFKVEKGENEFRAKYGCFTFYTNRDKMSEADKEEKDWEDDFADLDPLMKNLFEQIKSGKASSLWNNYSFKRPSYVDVKNVWNGGEDINHIDDFIFCCDELFEKYLELFSQTDMLEKIKTLKKGDVINGKYEVLSVKTKVNDEYYHGVGLDLKGTNGADSERWNDVYSLTRWYYDDIFEIKEETK